MVKQGTIIKINFNPQSGHEQAGYRPAVVISNNIFNENDFILAKQYCNLKYKSMEFNLAEKAALNNVSVLENDDIGVQELINKMNFYESRNLEIDKAKTKNYKDAQINKSDILQKIKNKFEKLSLNEHNKNQPDAYIG